MCLRGSFLIQNKKPICLGRSIPRQTAQDTDMIKKYKREDGATYALGATLVMELLNKKPELARAVYISPKSNVEAVTDCAEKHGVPVIESEKAINIVSPKGNCFAVGVFDKFSQKARADRHHVVLVNPSDSGNLGTVMRTVAAFDCADLIIIRPAVDAFDPKTVRAGMGAIFNIAFSEFDSFDEYIAEYKDRKMIPFMLGGSNLADTEYLSQAEREKHKKCSLVFGNEATGLPPEFEKYGAVKIEQSKNVDSLNLSIAVGVGLYKLYTNN